MKLDKELYTKHAKRLTAILNEKSSFVPYLTKADFVKVIENSLNTLHAVEKTLTKVELAAKYSSKTLTKEFNKLGKNSFSINEKFKYEDQADLIDNINYLHMYCKNIFKVNLDDLVEGKDVKACSPKIDLKAKTDVEELTVPGIASGMGMGMAMSGMETYQNPFIMGQAYSKIKQDTMNGKIYTYTSKPRSVVVAKIAAIATVSLTIITLIVAAIFAFMSAKYQVIYQKSGGGTEPGVLSFNATGPGIMYILIAMFGCYPLYQLFKGLLVQNNNLKYYFNWPWILIFIIMGLLFVMPDMRVTWFLTADKDITSQPATAKMAFNAWKIMYIVVLSSFGLCLVPVIIGAVNNPKQDQALLESLLRQYADELMGSYKTPTGSDVQKPVDVKKPEKEDKKPKTDTKTKK